MDRPPPRIRDLARQILERQIEKHNAPLELVAAIEESFQHLHKNLFNLLGHAGFHALMTRAAHLTKLELGSNWTEDITIPFEPVITWMGLAETIEREGAAQVKGAAVALLANVIGLLCIFIGEDLTLLFIHRIWTGMAPAVAVTSSKEGRTNE